MGIMKIMSELPVAVIGAGPVGLAAAAQLLKRGTEPIVFESGATVGANVLEWGHVRIFSPWKYDIDPAARQLLTATGWTEPDGEGYPTGRELVELYLAPLGAALGDRVRLRHRVTAIARLGFDKMKTEGRVADLRARPSARGRRGARAQAGDREAGGREGLMPTVRVRARMEREGGDRCPTRWTAG